MGKTGKRLAANVRRTGRKLRALFAVPATLIAHPVDSLRVIFRIPSTVRAIRLARGWQTTVAESSGSERTDVANPLQAYFDANQSGRGIFKWLHYFDAYHAHLEKFIGTEVCLVEVGVFGGGSLGMWRDYFGAGCKIWGIDIDEACRSYEGEGVKIAIGDQQDRSFWRQFKKDVPQVDILLDDGGHRPEQQAVTLEEMLPHLKPGGVFICEDIHGRWNTFSQLVAELTTALHEQQLDRSHDPRKGIRSPSSSWQSDIRSIHVYPYAIVIEKADRPTPVLEAVRHGTQWPVGFG